MYKKDPTENGPKMSKTLLKIPKSIHQMSVEQLKCKNAFLDEIKCQFWQENVVLEKSNMEMHRVKN